MADIIRFEDNWEFCFDAADAGVEGQWFRLKPAGTRKVTLPHLFSQEPNPENASIGFYFREFTLEKKDAVKRFMLRLHSVHPHCTVWLNGEQLGARSFGHVPFDLDAAKALKPTEKNLLAIRVQTPDKQGKLGEVPAAEMPLGNPWQRGAYAGITAPVELHTAAKAIVRSIQVLPDFEADRITVEVRFHNPKSFQTEAAFDITNPSGETGTLVKNIRLDKENGSYLMTLQLDGGKVWSPATPALYTLQLRLPGTPVAKVRFGMRCVEVEKGAFRLNHAGFKVRGTGYPWFFNFQHGLPAHPVDHKAELTAIREAGFNVVRGFGAPLPPHILDLCDELGLLVLQETTAYNMKSSKDGVDAVKAQLQALIERDGHHPSVLGWVVGAENGSLALENGNKLLRLAADLDPTRPVFSNLGSVLLDNQGGGKIDLGKVYEPVTTQIVPFEGHKLRLGYPLSRRGYAMLTNYCTSKDGKSVADGIHGNKSYWERYNYLKDQVAGKVLVDGLGVPVFGDLAALAESAKKFASTTDIKDVVKLQAELELGVQERGLPWKTAAALLADVDAFGRAALVRQIEALFSNTQVSGYFVENAVDQGLRFTGLFDAMRAPKTALLESLKAANRPMRVFAEAEERTPYTGSNAAIKVHVFNEGGLGDYSVQFRVKGPNGRDLHKETLTGKARTGLNAAGRLQFPVGFERGRYSFELVLLRNNKELARTEESFFVPAEVKLDNVLKKVTLLGAFPDTVSWSSTEDAPVTVVAGLTDVSDAALKRALDRAAQGGALVLGCLTEEDNKRLQGLKGLGADVTAFRSAGGPHGAYHYLCKSPVFKDMPAPGLMDETFAEVQPQWSLELSGEKNGKAEILAGAFVLNTNPGAKSKVRWGADVAVLPHGKGKVVFCQYDVFERLGKNALADALFVNLVQFASK